MRQWCLDAAGLCWGQGGKTEHSEEDAGRGDEEDPGYHRSDATQADLCSKFFDQNYDKKNFLFIYIDFFLYEDTKQVCTESSARKIIENKNKNHIIWYINPTNLC